MEEFRRQFLLEAVASLENLQQEFQTAESFSDSRKSQLFRTLHTVKGTSQTFGFQTSSRLAHYLETQLANLNAENFSVDGDAKTVFSEGIAILIDSFKQKDFQIPDSYREKIESFENTSDSSFSDFWDDSLSAIPEVFLSQLSSAEENNLRAAMRDGKIFYCLEVEFDLASFADGLIAIREKLETVGEIIATLPGAHGISGGKIGFQILLASRVARSEINKIAAESAARVTFDSAAINSSNDLTKTLTQILKHGKAVANALGKEVEFEILCGDFPIAPDKLKIVFEVLVHLVRNAVDHAFEQMGNVKIFLTCINNQVQLGVSDNGRGIDLQKIKQKALEKNLIAVGQNLTEQETIQLIFLPEFSTKSEVSEISGRGVGLDAVKSILEKNGGQITAKNLPEKGAIFEINLPL